MLLTESSLGRRNWLGSRRSATARTGQKGHADQLAGLGYRKAGQHPDAGSSLDELQRSLDGVHAQLGARLGGEPSRSNVCMSGAYDGPRHAQ